ncbi:general secretion pathway protein GspB [Massilia agri]|uniref:General secretion pathway protein GspB n=1 Tax=Massilia agri TaxID=1886785 RepID=A0ABT2ANE5_9BURK|nr:general secretion pathway protein GspB [Massilia agri]MCS0597771.1 general secretion pathway protein GspB [Massilia agri]
MSYILDALKKAQAERQLGNAPTIHAPPPMYAAAPGGASRKPLYIGLGAGAIGLALAGVFLLRQPAPVPVVEVAAAPAPAPAPVTVPAPPVPVALPPEPVKPREAPVQPKPTPRPVPKAEAPRRAEPVVAEAPPPAPEPTRPVLVAAAPAVEENIGPLAALPEAVQRDIPKVTFGGYIYSPNPAERLLLVDKMLRREGEEVAPGLVLERLLPKAAIMNYRGYRYRVAY